MFKRFLSFLLPFALVFSLLPVSAFASEVEPLLVTETFSKTWSGFPNYAWEVPEGRLDDTNAVLMYKEQTGQYIVVAFYNMDDVSYQVPVFKDNGDFEILSYDKTTHERTEGKFKVQVHELRELSNGPTWLGTYSAAPDGYYSTPYVSEFLSSDVDIYDDSGNVVFQKAPLLWEGVEAELKGKALPRILEAASTLTLCGVGLLALLIGCALLPKVLRRFLG